VCTSICLSFQNSLLQKTHETPIFPYSFMKIWIDYKPCFLFRSLPHVELGFWDRQTIHSGW
jgi:hypothetical protein